MNQESKQPWPVATQSRWPGRGLALLLAITGCSATGEPALPTFEVSGRLEDARILEASGLAPSRRQPDRLWIINDRGSKARVHAIDPHGARLGEFDLKQSRNRDWEDLASFELDNEPYLMVADIGDNNAKRAFRTLYFVTEPEAASTRKAETAWRVDFCYPDGSRDAESAAVDSVDERVLVLSKRDLPPVLYALPLRAAAQETLTATRLGPIHSLPKPTTQELKVVAKTKDWYWQPVGMDISADNRAIVVITYRALYYYERHAGQSWYEALNSKPLRISLGNFANAEAVSFGDNNRTVFVTGENKHSRLLRIDLTGVTTQ